MCVKPANPKAKQKGGRGMQKLDLPGLRQARPQDHRQLADITAEAFRDDPLNRWIFGPPRAILSAFRTLAPAYLKTGLCYLSGDLGATMWTGPGQSVGLTFALQMRFLAGMWRHASPGAMTRIQKIGRQMADHHPESPHFYLFTIGTRATARGQGIGRALIQPMLDVADQRDLPVYLENSNPANHGFYAAHGFEKTGDFNAGGTGPVVSPMLRAPRRA
jgi:GNAT superfamily N-acetyltransferase